MDVPSKLIRRHTPNGEVTAKRHGSAGNADFGWYACDLPCACTTLDLLNAIGVHPETTTPGANVTAAGRDWVWTLDADIGLIEIEGFTKADAAEP